MEMKPLVSILVPVYNVETFIERCARSVFVQTYTALEFVFVDDGCTDSSMTILNRVIDDYPCHKQHVIVIHHSQNRGLAAARNTAVASCSGDYIFHVDSDDWIEPDAVEALVKRQQETDADIVYTSGYYKHGKETQEIYCHGWSSDKESLLANILQDKATICMWSKLINTKLYSDNGIVCDERGSFYEDFQTLSRLVYYARSIVRLDAFVYHYNRQNSSSLVSNLSRNVAIQRQGLVSIKKVINFFKDKELPYLDLAKQFYICYIYKMLNANFRHRNKEGYNEFLDYLLHSEREYWYVIGWNKPWKRILDKHYQLKILFSLLWRGKQ